MRQLLDTDIQHIEALIATVNIHHRHARSINMLGTVLKVVAGTPDSDDLENLKFTQKELVESENRQVTINTKMQEQINKLTDTVNLITKTKQIDTEHLYETLLSRNRIIISELETLMLSVTLAKVGIVNPSILDSSDLKNIVNEHPINITITDLMEVSQVKVLLNNNFLHFIIRYPKPNIVCKKLTIYPVQHDGIVINFAEDYDIAVCDNHVISIGNCSTALTTTFCKKLPYTTCAQQLHSGGTAHCSTRPSHLEPLTIIDDGVIIINDRVAIVDEQMVKGTFLLTFDNEIKVNGTVYKNPKKYVRKSPRPAASTLLNITDHQEIPSLPYLQKLSIKNIRDIAQIEEQLVKRPIISGLTVVIILLSCYASMKLYQRHQRSKRQLDLQAVINSLKNSEDVIHLSGGGVNTIDQQNVNIEADHAFSA